MVSKSSRATTLPTAPPPVASSGLDRWFGITERGSTVAAEVRGGLVTFFTMAYIVVLNPLIIGMAPDKNGNLISGAPYQDASGAVIGANVGPSIAMVAAATALIAGLMTIAMGVYGRYPLGLATGLGLNALLAYGIVRHMSWPEAMGLVVWEGILITLLVLTGVRRAIFKAVPRSLRTAISAGIGLFIAFVGLVDAGVVRIPVTPEGKPASTVPVELGVHGTLLGWPIAVFVLGFVLLVALYVRKVKGAMLIAILAATVVAMIIEAVAKIGPSVSAAGHNPLGWALNVPTIKAESLLQLPDLSLLGRVDLLGAFRGGPSAVIYVVLTIFALLLADFFDTMGTIVAVGSEAGILDEDGNPPHTQEVLLVDSLAAVAGGLGSVSSNTSYIESAAGVGEGARTGLASVVTGAGFLVAMFLAPLVNLVPSEAAAPVLFFVGYLMMMQVVDLDWHDVETAVPAFVTMVLMPFTYSITAGIGAGFVLYVLIKMFRGKARSLHPLLIAVALLFVVYFAQGLILSSVG